MDFRRDSFSDRVCDDLSQILLKYLSLEDKLKLECVSKQFQRTVFQKHYVFDERFLNFLFKGNTFVSESRLRGSSSDPRVGRNRYLNGFSSILKKCPNI